MSVFGGENVSFEISLYELSGLFLCITSQLKPNSRSLQSYLTCILTLVYAYKSKHASLKHAEPVESVEDVGERFVALTNPTID